ncbi:MAG: C40 family peptidase [Rhodocyclaceae bacterium]|jgi:cell wall-associated NlpC family hydrolase|nr:C40 family peptidase [Rhodocyclaceae bacterium]
MQKFSLLLVLWCAAALPAHADEPATPPLQLQPTLSLQENSVALVQRTVDTVHTSVQATLDEALEYLGIRYRRGGSTPETGFDCSGFVRYVFNESLGLELPHNAMAISRAGERVEKSELMPGDLVFFNTMRRAFSHVGIYLGNNRFIHAPRSGTRVRIEDMGDRYWSRRYNGARRVSS